MKQENSMSNLIKSQCSLSLHGGGSVMLNIIIIIVIFASIISAVVYMSSSSMRQAVSSNQSANAWNLAEAGYRFLSTNYLNTTNVSGNADYDKADFLRKVNGRTYVIPNNGQFTLTILPYWFYNATVPLATGTITSVNVQLPGTIPANFTMPATGQIKLGDTAGVETCTTPPCAGIRNYTGGAFNSSTGVFTCTISSYTITTVYSGYSAYLVLNPSASSTLTPGSNLTLNLSTFPAGAFPSRNGLIEIGSDTRLYKYKYATLSGTVLTLKNLQHSDGSTFSKSVTAGTTGTTVTFKKYIMAQSRGQVGPEQRTLSFNQAITDSVSSAQLVVVKLDTAAGLSTNFSQSSSVASYEVQTLQTSGGGSAAFSIIDSLATTGSGANAYQCGAFWYSGTSTINQQWAPQSPTCPTCMGNYLLSYDVQVKPATGNALTAGTIGLAIRAKKVTSTTEPDTYLGLTFMKYDLPNLYFNRQTGTTAINYGDTVVGATSGATGIVQGTPEITSGSWLGGNAAGKIRFASVTGTFSADEYLRVGGVNRVQVNGSNYFPAATTDYIPGAIKPKPSDFSPARYNIGPLLLVLWERKSDGTFRWLAFKDISNDDYAKGRQDWVEPVGSCTNPPSSCNGSDGLIIDDNASVYVRIQEKRVVLGSGSAVKVNDINLFYGDATSRYISPTWPARPGNALPYDIKDLRRNYAVGSPFTPIWVPPSISQWEQSVDFFSHIESGTPPGSQPQFQWDAVNPSAVADIISGGGVLKICNDASAACTSAENGSLRLTELVTPDSGTYNQPEIGMFACGNLRTSPDYATAGFAEFALKTSSGGSTTGGFSGGSLSW
jgi:hypothetical protein